MSKTKQQYTLSEIEDISNVVLDECDDDNIILFYGEMGAGKTTLINAICNLLGIEDTTNSPTYALINEYDADGDTVYHMDLFRLKDLDEAIEIGIEDYLYSDSLCLIEWPEIILELMPLTYTKVSLFTIDESTREITIEKVKVIS